MARLSNHKHEAFAQEYLKDRNGSAAAIRAGYSVKTARAIAYDLLHREDIKARVAELAAGYLKAVQEDAASVLRLVVTQANTGIAAFIKRDEDGNPDLVDGQPVIDFASATPAQIDTLQELTVETYLDGEREVKRVKLKAGDRLKAIDKLWEFTKLAEVHAKTQADAFASAIDQLARVRGSSMPIGKGGEDDDA